MSSIKRYIEDMMDPDRIEPQPGKYVSAACFEDSQLRAFIKRNRTSHPCSYYCGGGRHPKGAALDDVLAFIFDGITSRYEDATNGVGWDGGFVGASTWDSYDLVWEHLELTDRAESKLLDDIAYALPDRTWSEIDPYGARDHEIFQWSWEKFVEVVKYERRYYFDDGISSEESISPGALLAVVASKCKRAKMIRKLPVGTSFYRCRWRDENERFTQPHELGPPPKELASQSRMSPAGIAMFYGAVDEATARAETLASDSDRHTMALFGLGRDIHVLDLTDSPAVSLFDPNRRSLYDWAIFMRHFRTDLRKPVAKDHSLHIDYVPTQIVTEYFRSFLTTRKGQPIDGILYKSATRTENVCIALFAKGQDVAPTQVVQVEPSSGYLLQLLSLTDYG
jgi:hypothetical protein